jgi:capsular polysaccharide biosynthesis protein
MKQVRDEGLVLAREVENAQRAFDLVMTRQNQTALESQATQSNVYVLTAAVEPVDHSSPRIMQNTVLAAVLGVVLAIGSCLVLELIDRRVRTAEDVVQAIDLPVIGTMPRPNAKRFAAGRGVSMLGHNRAVGLPAPVKEASWQSLGIL